MPMATPILDELEWRGLIAQSTDRDALAEALDHGPLTVYSGFDPTAPSLHAGHLIPPCSRCGVSSRPGTDRSCSPVAPPG